MASVPAPELTVIVPVFNGAASVLPAVASLLEHTRASLEVICVDDGSTDKLQMKLRRSAREALTR